MQRKGNNMNQKMKRIQQKIYTSCQQNTNTDESLINTLERSSGSFSELSRSRSQSKVMAKQQSQSELSNGSQPQDDHQKQKDYSLESNDESSSSQSKIESPQKEKLKTVGYFQSVKAKTKPYKEQKFVPHYQFKLGEVFNKVYVAERFIADGTFGRVLLVRHRFTNVQYAMKIIKSDKKNIKNAQLEVEILEILQKQSSDGRHKIVKIVESFHYQENYCLVFERLGKSLFEVIQLNNYIGYPMFGIRQMLWEILNGITFLHQIGLTHTDLKPENILFADTELKQQNGLCLPKQFSIKIIDFGAATFDEDHHTGVINTRQYRAPEVILGFADWNQKSDMWCLGCIAIELYTGSLYFKTRRNDYEHLAMIEKTCGSIPKEMIGQISNATKKYFTDTKQPLSNSYSKWPSQATQECQRRVKQMKIIEQIIHPKHHLFIDLIRKMLIIDHVKRISASEALQHKFFNED